MVKPMKLKSNKSSTASSNIIGMSSDVDDDQVLPDSLRKLEIVSVYSNSLAACKTTNECHQNPFLTELSTVNSVDDRITKDLFGPSCSNCKNTDKSCIADSMSSIGDEMDSRNRNWRYHGSNSSGGCGGDSSSNSNSGNGSGNSSGTGQDIVHSINKTTHFKHRDREKASAQLLSEKKLAILREPILKSIGRSVYHNGHQNKLCCELKSCVERKCHKDERINVTNSASTAGPRPEVGHTSGSTANAPTEHHHRRIKLCHHCAANVSVTSGGVPVECQNNLASPSNKTDQRQRGAAAQTNVAAVAEPNNLMMNRIQNWRLADDANVVDFKSLVNECSNLTLCAHGTSPNNSIIELHKTRNFQILQANQIGGTTAANSSDTQLSLLSSPLSNDGLNPAMQASAGNNAMNCSLNSNSSASSTNSSSCSQQARMNSSNCDVTIDELASYIEFQLHLPKPMSSNVYEAMFS